MPFFEAGTEVFLRDWQETVLRVVVRDSALREKDAILGIVNFPLKDVFTESSEVTGLYSLQEGIGFGLVPFPIFSFDSHISLDASTYHYSSRRLTLSCPKTCAVGTLAPLRSWTRSRSSSILTTSKHSVSRPSISSCQPRIAQRRSPKQWRRVRATAK